MLLIFDWDGTLIDSTGKITRCMRRACEHLQLPHRSDAQMRNVIGLGLTEGINQLFEQLDEARIEQLKAVYSRFFIEADETPCSLYPGVMDSLLQLKADGHTLAVATGKSRKGLNRVLNNLQMDGMFDITRCADEALSKPHPLMLQQILSELNASAADAVMVGDTEYDLEMATHAGMDAIAVSYGAHEVERLQNWKPRLTIDHFPQLLQWVDNDR